MSGSNAHDDADNCLANHNDRKEAEAFRQVHEMGREFDMKGSGGQRGKEVYSYCKIPYHKALRQRYKYRDPP